MDQDLKSKTLKRLADDKASCPPGPWTDEPDRVDFKSDGLTCFIQRGPNSHWCGYVGVPEGHPYYGLSYNEIGVDVHWGLTYSAHCQDSICHIPEPGDPDTLYWLGFDCLHSGDVSPRQLGRACYFGPNDTYKDINFVTQQTKRLARQLAELI